MSGSSSQGTLSLGLIGFPLTGSLSPLLHSAALKSMGLSGAYDLYPIDPTDDVQQKISDLINRLRMKQISGLNVTLPYKQTVIPLLDQLTSAASAIGAVNTIYWQDGEAIGDNTDAPAFIQDLKSVMGWEAASAGENRDPIPVSALVLGGGGAARAAVYALWKAGWSVGCSSRRIEQSRSIVADMIRQADLETLAEKNLSAIPLLKDAVLRFLRGSQGKKLVLVNASSAGMSPNALVSPWLEEIPLPENAFVYDLIYKPAETKFMKDARMMGFRAYNGLGMLIEQAALSLEIWSGQPVPREAMRIAIN